MPGQALHRLDAFLCRHARDNIHWNIDDEGIARRIRALDPRLAAFITTEDVPAVGEYLLTDDEFDDLIVAASGSIVRPVDRHALPRDAVWYSPPDFFGTVPSCTADINRHLSPTEAERWSTDSYAVVETLTGKDLGLAQGLEVVQGWVSLIRSYLRAMQLVVLIPPPLGSFRTPTHPTPLPVIADTPVNVERDAGADLARMKRAIAEHPKGAKASQKALIRIAKINYQAGLKALRQLEALGEYRGFQESKDRRRK